MGDSTLSMSEPFGITVSFLNAFLNLWFFGECDEHQHGLCNRNNINTDITLIFHRISIGKYRSISRHVYRRPFHRHGGTSKWLRVTNHLRPWCILHPLPSIPRRLDVRCRRTVSSTHNNGSRCYIIFRQDIQGTRSTPKSLAAYGHGMSEYCC